MASRAVVAVWLLIAFLAASARSDCSPPVAPAFCNGCDCLMLVDYVASNLTIVPGQTFQVVGDLTLSGSAVTTLTAYSNISSAPIKVPGGIFVNGSLVLNLMDRPKDGETVPIISGNVTGRFRDVRVNQPDKCFQVTVTQLSSIGISLSYKLRVVRPHGKCSGLLPGGVVAAIVICSFLGVGLIGLFVGVLFRYILPRCRHEKPFGDDDDDYVIPAGRGSLGLGGPAGLGQPIARDPRKI